MKLNARVSCDGMAGERQGDAGEERGRLIDVFTKLAAEGGFRSVNGEAVARQAGLAPEAFHEHFADELRCLTAAYDAFFERIRDNVAEAAGEEGDWPLRVCRAVAACLECLSDMESRARLFAVDANAAGPAMLERRFAHIGLIAEHLRGGRRHFPSAERLAANTEWMLISGGLALVTSWLLAERGPELPRLEVELAELLLIPYLGSDEARRTAQAQSRQVGEPT
jgi:AcrR family transcriptional regulator